MMNPQRRFAIIASATALTLVLISAQSSTASHISSPDLTCSSSAACLLWENTSSGPGLKGQSDEGTGILGVTHAGQKTANKAGVSGTDTSGSFNNSGVIGTSAAGNGVYGSTTHATIEGAGVFGHSDIFGVRGSTLGTSGILGAGVLGEDVGAFTTTSGVRGLSQDGYGVSGHSSSGDGVYGITDGASSIGVFGENNASSIGGIGVMGSSDFDGIGVYASNAGSTEPALRIHLGSVSCPSTCNPEIIADSPVGDVMSLDSKGDMILKGSLTQNGTPLIVGRTSRGQDATTFVDRTAAPTLEDFGEAQLVNGAAQVRLDPSFAAAIDGRASYLVFLTPEGMVRGTLCVVSRAADHFVVQESGDNGRSSVAFAYRIVARPFGATAARMSLYRAPIYRIGRALPPVRPL